MIVELLLFFFSLAFLERFIEILIICQIINFSSPVSFQRSVLLGTKNTLLSGTTVKRDTYVIIYIKRPCIRLEQHNIIIPYIV